MQIAIGHVTNEGEHAIAMKRLGEIWGATEGDDLDELCILARLVDEYEATLFPTAGLDPIEVIHGMMDHAGRSRAELVELVGSASRTSEVLNRRRALTVDMIRAISHAWNVPQDLLTRAYRVETRASARRAETRERA